MTSTVRARASAATRTGTRSASRNSTSACAAIMAGPHGHGGDTPACPDSSWDRASKAITTVAVRESHSAGTGRHSASATAAPCASEHSRP
ncbi:hypothetical protein QFZ75_004191 [Streptomyces sp. V3I8]|nr:hypothetical protein [Streptomyces sp. V3I8]